MKKVSFPGLAGEAARNLIGSPIRTAVLMMVFVFGFQATMVEAYSATRSGRQQETTLLADGINVAAVTAQSISGKTCSSFNRISGVQAAGAVIPLGQTLIQPGDSSTFLTYRVTPGFFSVMADSKPAPVGGVLVDQQTTAELSLDRPSLRTISFVGTASGGISGSTQTLIRPMILSKRGVYYERSVFIVGSSTQSYNECYVLIRNPAPNLTPQLLAADSGISSAQGSWLIDRSTIGSSPVQAFESRTGRWTWLILSLITGLVVAGLSRSRSVEYALYRSNGATLPVVAAVVLPEYWIAAAVSVLYWPVSVAVAGGSVDFAAIQVGLKSGTAYLAAALLFSTIITVLGMRGSPWELLRRD